MAAKDPLVLAITDNHAAAKKNSYRCFKINS